MGGDFYISDMASIFNAGTFYIDRSSPAAQRTSAVLSFSMYGRTYWLSGNLPVTGLSITQSNDLSVAKAFSGDIWVASFGRGVVNIDITGITLFYSPCSGTFMNPNTSSPLALIDVLNTLIDNNTYISISVVFGNKMHSYNGVLQSAKVNGSSEAIGNGMEGDFSLRFVGQDARS